MTRYADFNMMTVPLGGKNLVEASAGTGKTFSIAILALRLILEKNINIRNILLVTFTNNAVAELDKRIREFIRQAKTCATSGTANIEQIKTITERATLEFGKEEVKKRLEDSILFLDETSIMTIHSFCKKSLDYLAFETGQSFEAELVTNVNDILEDEVNNFWRNNIVNLSLDILKFLVESGFSRNKIKNVLKNHLGRKKFHSYNSSGHYEISEGNTREINALNIEKKNTIQDFKQYLKTNKQEIEFVLGKTSNKKKFLEKIENPEELLKELESKSNTNYFEKLPDELQKFTRQYSEIHEKIKKAGVPFFDILYCKAIKEIESRVKQRTEREGILTFDNLIQNLHAALEGPNRQRITQELTKEYKAVFIDEFQDTDKLQYDIFKKSFDNSILFFIGDPKQSIYAFRQADINTYLKARDEVDHLYSMNTNFRSSEKMIKAINQFFLPQPGFDTFYFQKEPNSINYVNVCSPDGNSKDFLKEENSQPGITIIKRNNNEEIYKDATAFIIDLLTHTGYKIKQAGENRNIKASDIGILVRGKKYGDAIRKELGKFHVPSVFVSDQKIMESDQASDLYFVLRAMYEPVMKNINSAVVNPFTGKQSFNVFEFDEEVLIELFKSYKLKWETEGIYSALSAYIADMGVMTYLSNPATPNGMRIITNLNHLMDLISKAAYHQHLNQAELLTWYQRSLNMDLIDADESEIRLESDADAVTIMTIHKSKGLEFNIVFAIQMDLSNSPDHDLISLYENESYITIPKDALNDEQSELAKKQTEQENRRLMYVAVTRAIYKAVIYKNENSKPKVTGLSLFLENLKTDENIEILKSSQDTGYIPRPYQQHGDNHEKRPATLKNEFYLKDAHWQATSYSALAVKTHIPIAVKDFVKTPNDYDEFIFSKLRKGDITGTMVHEIFEKIDFKDDQNNNHIISYAVNRYASSKKEDYSKHLPQLIKHVLHANIPRCDGNFQLDKISIENRVAEMEFDFMLDSNGLLLLHDLLIRENIPVRIRQNQYLQGMMNGFIDLFFKFEDKYYILDWKTNFLGNRIEDYNSSGVRSAMETNNYHLQYLIYTLAIKKYLKYKLGNFSYDDFGGAIYCFVRGMRENTSEGIYFTRPSENVITEMEKILDKNLS